MRVKQWENTPKSKSTPFELTPQISNCFKKSTSLKNSNHCFFDRRFTDRRHLAIKTTTVHRIDSKDYAARRPSCIVAAVDGADEQLLLHPLTLKPHHCNLPHNFNLSNFDFHKASLFSFHRTKFNFDKIVVPLSRAKVLSDNTMFILLGGGKLIGRPFLVEGEQPTSTSTPPWVRLSDKRFDDIVVCGRKDEKIYVVDRLGKLHLLGNNVTSRVLRFNTAFDSLPLGRVGWRKRLFEGFNGLYLVVRVEEKVFRVYKLVRKYKSPYCWEEIIRRPFGGKMLCVSKYCYFFRGTYGRKEYEDCIVFSESGFPKYGDDGWDYNSEDEIRVFRMSDGRYGRVGESAEFPEIDWSPPSWVLDEGSCSSVNPRSQTEGYDRLIE